MISLLAKVRNKTTKRKKEKVRKLIIQTATEVSTEVTAVTLDNTNAEELIAKFNEAKIAIKQLEAQKSEAEKALRELMGNSEVGLIAGVERVKIATRVRGDLNREHLKTAFPEAYDACMETKPYTVLTAVS